ncbi:MAG: hypothetical protein ACRDYX_15300 [Egibacteraceae bacterium]
MLRRWVNIADHDGFIAPAPDLTALFGPSTPSDSSLEGGWTLDNGTEPHAADLYLTKKQTETDGTSVGQILTSTDC